MAKQRLAFLTSHPIQYQAPLFRKLAACSEIDLHVYFCSRFGLDGKTDPGFGVRVKWDVPVLDGYRHGFLKNFSPVADSFRFWSLVNPSIVREIAARRHDAVIVHGYAYATDWLAFASAMFCGIPLLLHGETLLHENRGSLSRSLKSGVLRRLFKRVRAFLYIGTRSRAFYKAHGVPDEKLFFTPYSVDNDFFIGRARILKPRKTELKREFAISESQPVILYASKFIARKRPLDLLKAFEPIQDKAVLVFVGDGEERGKLENYAASRKTANVRFMGFKNQTELPKFYALADVFVLPSEFETWGLAVNEAMCFGLPIVTTSAVPASADLVAEGENGFVVEPGDVSALSERLDRLVGDPALLAKQGERSLELISAWNHDVCVEGIRNALHSAAPGKENSRSFYLDVED